MSTNISSRRFRPESILLLGVALAAMAVFFWARRSDSALRWEVAGLENRRADLSRLQRDNEGLASAIARLEALPAKPQRAPRPQPAPVVLPPGFKHLGELQNVGAATPAAAFESYLWALDHGEPGELAKLLVLSDAARAQLEASFARLPAREREKYATAQGMFALIYAEAAAPRFIAVQTGDESSLGSNQVALETKWQFPLGQIRDHPVPLYHTAEGWRVIVPDSKVESVIHDELELGPVTEAAAPP